MTISFSLPRDIENLLRESAEDPSSAIKEAALVDLYRMERITHHQLAEALGVGRIETDEILKRHDVPIDLTAEEFRAELSSLRKDLGG